MAVRPEIIRAEPGKEIAITLQSRGGIGLQLGYSIDKPEIVQLRRQRVNESEVDNRNIGGGIAATFIAKVLKAGVCTVRFFETQRWNPAFEPITVKVIQIDAGE